MKFSCWRHEKSQILNWNFWKVIDLFCFYKIFLLQSVVLSHVFDRWKSDRKNKSIQLQILIKNCQNRLQILFYLIILICFLFSVCIPVKVLKLLQIEILLSSKVRIFCLKIWESVHRNVPTAKSSTASRKNLCWIIKCCLKKMKIIERI